MLMFESSVTTRGEEMCPRVTRNLLEGREENGIVFYNF